MNLITDYFPIHHGHYSTTPLKPGIERRKEMDKSMTNESVTAKSESYTIGAGPRGWVCPLCGRSVNPNFMHCSCGGWRYPNQPNWAPGTPWYTTVTCKEETSTQPKTFCSGFMHIEGMD